MRGIPFLLFGLSLIPVSCDDARIPAGTIGLIYRQSGDQYRLLVTCDGSTRVYPLGPCSGIDSLVRVYLASIRARAADKPLGRRLYRTLLPTGVGPGRKLVIRAKGQLGQLPFECLPDGDRFLAATVAIRYARDETDLDPPDRSKSFRKPALLAVAPDLEGSGLPALPFARLETDATAQLHPGLVLRETELPKQRFLELAPQHDILHLATHACPDPDDSGSSCILLRDRGRTDTVFRADISKLDLRAQLLILGACGNGDGLIRAFRKAGARNVLASVWPLPDKYGAALVRSFYRHLLLDSDPAIALQRARADFLATADARGAEPYYWGGLVLCGDGSPVRLQPVAPGAVFLFDGLILLITAAFFFAFKKYNPARRARRG